MHSEGWRTAADVAHGAGARISAGPDPAKPPGARRGSGPRRAVLGVLVAVALTAAAGHALLWRWACGRLEEGFAGWAASRRAEGWRVEHTALSRGGWPLAATLAVPEFRLEGGAEILPGGMDWRPEALVLRVSPARLDRLVVEMPGRHRLRLGGAALSFSAEGLDVALPVEASDVPREAAAAAQRLRFDTPGGATEIRAAALVFDARAGGDKPATALRVSAADATLPPGSPGADRLGRAVERIGVDLLLTGSVPPGRDPVRRAAAWRDSGGVLEVRALDARWGEAAATASGTLTLDGALQPAGAGTLRLAGGEALLDAAGNAGLLPPLHAAAARVALRALSRPPPDGGPARAELPMALRNRSLSLGGVPVARLPAWDWGAPGPGAVPKPVPPRE